MRTNKIKIPDAIITSDIHVQANSPVARTDNYLEALAKKLRWLKRLQRKYNNCPILDAGDLLSNWKIDPELEQWCMDYIPKNFYTTVGNHDMPNHNMKLFKKSSLSLLNKTGTIKVLKGTMDICKALNFSVLSVPYGLEISEYLSSRILITHQMVCEEKQHHRDHYTYSTGKALLKKHPQFDLIISGHNHESFVIEYKGRLLVNPGSLMRRDASQIDYQPRVFLWYSDTNTVKSINVPITERVITTEHLEKAKERDDRIEAFTKRLDSDIGSDLDFETNMEYYLIKNKISGKLKEMTWKFIT